MDAMAEMLEQAEAELMWDFEHPASPEVQAALGLSSVRIGGGVALAVANDVTGYFSKALGFGFGEPVTAALIADVVDFYRDAGVEQATLQLAPSVLPRDWAAICEKTGLRPGGEWVKVARLAGLVESVDTGLRIAQVEPAQARDWSIAQFAAFGMPEMLAPMVQDVVGLPNWAVFTAWDGDRIVGCGSVRINGQTAAVSAGATLPEYRRRGVQSALIAARVRYATAAGVKWLGSETGRPAEGEHNSSLANLLRAGFEIRYPRQNWIWRPAESVTDPA